MTSRVDTHIRCCLKNNSPEIREPSLAAHLLTMQFLLKYWFPGQNLDWNPGGRNKAALHANNLSSNIKRLLFPLLLSAHLFCSGKNDGKLLSINCPLLETMVEVSC